MGISYIHDENKMSNYAAIFMHSQELVAFYEYIAYNCQINIFSYRLKLLIISVCFLSDKILHINVLFNMYLA